MLWEEIMAPGVKVSLNAPMAPFPHCNTVFRGQKSGDYLIVDCPLQNGRSLPFERGMECVLRLMSLGTVYGFKAKVLGMAARPFPLLFLTWPERVEQVALRKGKTFQVLFDAWCLAEPGGGVPAEPPNGMLLRLGEEGGLLETGKPLRLDRTCHLSFVLPEFGAVADLAIRPRSCQSAEGVWRVEFVFGDPGQAGHELLRRYLRHLDEVQLSEALLRTSPLGEEPQ